MLRMQFGSCLLLLSVFSSYVLVLLFLLLYENPGRDGILFSNFNKCRTRGEYCTFTIVYMGKYIFFFRRAIKKKHPAVKDNHSTRSVTDAYLDNECTCKNLPKLVMDFGKRSPKNEILS